jgi:hypothetical protein
MRYSKNTYVPIMGKHLKRKAKSLKPKTKYDNFECGYDENRKAVMIVA